MKPPREISLNPGKRVLFLTKDAELIRQQLSGKLALRMVDIKVEDLLDDINTDTMTPAWACFRHRPEDIARNAYAGLIVDGKRLFEIDALKNGNFEVIVSGYRKGVGSSRETAVQAEKWSGIRLAIAASFAPIHAANNVNQGVLMGNHDQLTQLQAGHSIPLEDFYKDYDSVTQLVIQAGGLFAFSKALVRQELKLPSSRTEQRAMTMAEKILARHVRDSKSDFVKPGDSVIVDVDGGYTHEFTTAQVHHFLREEYGADYQIRNPEKFAVFEDHLIFADQVQKMRAFLDQIETLRQLQRDFQQHTGVQDFSAKDGVSPGICHEVARERLVAPGEFILATDSHTCMGGCNNALTWGVGTTEYANLIYSGFATVEVPESIRFVLTGRFSVGVTAKDLMLYILLHFAKSQQTLNRIMEFTGAGLATLSMDERATLTNMATECSARGAIVEADELTFDWISQRRPELGRDQLLASSVLPDANATYHGGIHTIDLSKIRPMVAHPGDPNRGEPSDPTNGAYVDEIGEVRVDIAYGGSCTAGKIDDLAFYHQVVSEAVEVGLKVPENVDFIIQFGSQEVEKYSRENGFLENFQKAGVRLIQPGCGACIGCGPGVSEDSEQVTISAINRNYKGRSGPGRLYLASPLTVAASAFLGTITQYRPGMFEKMRPQQV